GLRVSTFKFISSSRRGSPHCPPLPIQTGGNAARDRVGVPPTETARYVRVQTGGGAAPSVSPPPAPAEAVSPRRDTTCFVFAIPSPSLARTSSIESRIFPSISPAVSPIYERVSAPLCGASSSAVAAPITTPTPMPANRLIRPSCERSCSLTLFTPRGLLPVPAGAPRARSRRRRPP